MKRFRLPEFETSCTIDESGDNVEVCGLISLRIREILSQVLQTEDVRRDVEAANWVWLIKAERNTAEGFNFAVIAKKKRKKV